MHRQGALNHPAHCLEASRYKSARFLFLLLLLLKNDYTPLLLLKTPSATNVFSPSKGDSLDYKAPGVG